MDDTVKAATDALYEAIKAKVLKDIEECKAKAKDDAAAEKALECKAINKFVTTTFVRDTAAPDISVRAMIMLYQKWCEQNEENSQWFSLTNPIELISAHHWVQRALYQDFKGLALGGWLAPQEPPQPATKSRGRPKKSNI